MSEGNILRIPVAGQPGRVFMRYSPLPRVGGAFQPEDWKQADLKPDQNPATPGWYELDLATLNLADGRYEYDFGIEGNPAFAVADPFAEEITRFGGYRGVFYISNGQRLRPAFSWDGEIPANIRLPGNHEMVIYELPMRWVDPGEDGFTRQVGLGTFDKAIFEWLQAHIGPLGINTIELLPIQDSPDTLNWGYGSRFFLAPDLDMGEPFDLKLFVKACHRQGIRVILDIVMNHSKKCPLENLAKNWYYIDPETEELFEDKSRRDSWGGEVFRYRDPVNGSYMAREFHYRAAEYWIREYHIDGFRIDEFKGINNWDFIREFRYRALKLHKQLFFDSRPFIVIAEDSWRRANATSGAYFPENGDLSSLRVTDAIWDFDFKDELRRLVSNTLTTEWGKPGRHERVQAMLWGDRLWDGGNWRAQGFADMAQRVTYCTSHDVESFNDRRMYSFYLDKLKSQWDEARQNYPLEAASVPEFETLAREMLVSSMALMLTCRGIPMFLAGEEFGDLHDEDPGDWRRKMSDPIDWYRRLEPGHSRVLKRVRELIALRTDPDAAVLKRNELEFFGMNGIAPGFQKDFDATWGGRVFAYCRTGGKTLGSAGQIAVVANSGWQDYPQLTISWPWPATMKIDEKGGKGQTIPVVQSGKAAFELSRFQVRVFKVSEP
jgi:pullulanase/glycogen debranching enzyme